MQRIHVDYAEIERYQVLAQQEKHANALPYSTVLLPVSHGYTRETAIVLILPFSPIFSISVPLSARRVLVFGPILILVFRHRFSLSIYIIRLVFSIYKYFVRISK